MNFEKIGIEELEQNELSLVSGGEAWYNKMMRGFRAGTRDTEVSSEDMDGFGWYSFGYGLGVSAREQVH
ncbi:hypothetical protein [Marinifilum flexuosum]|uniref:hypothetical protein n=1 Tax=Marinifilum flexuosum TaxID=1117708 RepID=UPI002492BDB4|nr:hypothetical protein [Marinifilum flexuosum]